MVRVGSPYKSRSNDFLCFDMGGMTASVGLILCWVHDSVGQERFASTCLELAVSWLTCRHEHMQVWRVWEAVLLRLRLFKGSSCCCLLCWSPNAQHLQECCTVQPVNSQPAPYCTRPASLAKPARD